MTDLQIVFAVGGAFGIVFGGISALVLVWLFQPARLYAALHIHTHPTTSASAELVPPPRRASHLRPLYATRQGPHRTADPTRRVPVAMATPGTH